MLLDGELKSGGSRANWLTIIPEGTEVEVRNVPEVALWAGDWFEYEIVENQDLLDSEFDGKL